MNIHCSKWVPTETITNLNSSKQGKLGLIFLEKSHYMLNITVHWKMTHQMSVLWALGRWPVQSPSIESFLPHLSTQKLYISSETSPCLGSTWNSGCCRILWKATTAAVDGVVATGQEQSMVKLTWDLLFVVLAAQRIFDHYQVSKCSGSILSCFLTREILFQNKNELNCKWEIEKMSMKEGSCGLVYIAIDKKVWLTCEENKGRHYCQSGPCKQVLHGWWGSGSTWLPKLLNCYLCAVCNVCDFWDGKSHMCTRVL